VVEVPGNRLDIDGVSTVNLCIRLQRRTKRT
jgi:hypothetical protein